MENSSIAQHFARRWGTACALCVPTAHSRAEQSRTKQWQLRNAIEQTTIKCDTTINQRVLLAPRILCSLLCCCWSALRLYTRLDMYLCVRGGQRVRYRRPGQARPETMYAKLKWNDNAMHCLNAEASAVRRLRNMCTGSQFNLRQTRGAAERSMQTAKWVPSGRRCSGISFEFLISWLMMHGTNPIQWGEVLKNY